MLHPEILQKFRVTPPNGPVVFIGESCDIFIPRKYESYGALTIQATVKTLGVFDMEVDGMLSGMFAPNHVEIVPSSIENVTIDAEPYVKLHLKKNDLLLKTTEVVKNQLITFPVYTEYVKSGRTLKAIPYEELSFLFDRIMKFGGIKFPVDHAIYEMIFAHLARKADDIMTPFRNTDMKGDYQQVPLTDVPHAATSTTSRVIGAYYTDGVNAAVNNHNLAPSSIEDILRQ